MTDILVIGGGAAGLAAACQAAKEGAAVTVWESAKRIGRKILASGNGRCNLLNTGDFSYFGDEKFALSVLENCGREEILSFFEAAGLRVCKESEEDGRLYPATGQANAVLDALRGYADRLGVQILTEKTCLDIVPCKKGFYINDEKFYAKKVIAAAGSPAGGNLGRDSYALLKNLGHTLIPPVPALSPLICDMKKRKNLKGLRVPANLLLTRKGRPVEISGGEILFTETGVSGVCAMQLGKAVQTGDELHIDFSPLLDVLKRQHFHKAADEKDLAELLASEEKIWFCLKERLNILPREYLLTGLLPRVLCDTADPSGKAGIREIAKNLSDFVLTVTGTKGMDGAQVAHGGMDTKEFDPVTMESRKIKGLYAAGEMLNVDGDCGGFNLMFAWSSGLLAGKNAARSLVK